MSLSTTTGTPPAVTHEQIESWNKIADDVTAALTMGGQQGLDLLTGLMAEWCEAVDDVNSARQICIDLADRGLRSEAIQWHAEGFFEVADRLDPDRPGWQEWAEAFRERDMVTPRIDPELKEMANRIHEDLAAKDISGQSLADHLGRLRQNMLLRGNLGERLLILETIRGMDAGVTAWEAMISPIRRRRVDMIADEAKAAIARQDYEALVQLREEVNSQDWGNDLPAGVATLLTATAHCAGIAEVRGRLSRAAATIVDQFEGGRRHPDGSPGRLAAEKAATAARAQYAAARAELVQAIQGASAVPETAGLVRESRAVEALRQLDAAVREPCQWLAQQSEAARVKSAAGEIEAKLNQTIEAAPLQEHDREEFDRLFASWQRQMEKSLHSARKAVAQLPGGCPASTEEVIGRLTQTRKLLEAHRRTLVKRELWIIFFVLGGVILLVLLIMGLILFLGAKR